MFQIVYCNDSGDVCHEQCEGEMELSDALNHIQNMNEGEVEFGRDIKEGQVMVFKGNIYTPRPKEVTTLWH